MSTMIQNGYRWDVIAYFLCNTSGVRVGIRKTKRDADNLATRFKKVNRKFGVEHVHVRVRYDPLLDEVMNPPRRYRRD